MVVTSGYASCREGPLLCVAHPFEAVAMPPVALSISFVMTWRYKLQIILYSYYLLSAKVPCALFIDIPALVFTAVANRSFSVAKLVTTCFLHSPR
jgi:hypothetical protein